MYCGYYLKLLIISKCAIIRPISIHRKSISYNTESNIQSYQASIHIVNGYPETHNANIGKR